MSVYADNITWRGAIMHREMFATDESSSTKTFNFFFLFLYNIVILADSVLFLKRSRCRHTSNYSLWSQVFKPSQVFMQTSCRV